MRRLGGVGEVHFQGKRKKKKKKTPTKSGVDGKIIGTKKKKKITKNEEDARSEEEGRGDEETGLV